MVFADKWIEYSITYDAAFCFPCRKFVNKNAEAQYVKDAFITEGLKIGNML